MKTLPFAIVASAIVLASCSSSKHVASSEYDDVYYNPNRAARQAAAVVTESAVTPQEAMTAQPIAQEPVYVQSQGYADENLSDYELYKLQREAEMLGESYEPQGSEALYAEQYQQYDSIGQYGQESAPVIINNYYTDPNDYYYSSNLRRFSDEYYGWNYYDPYYTDMYFYTGRSMHWGMSIGMGYPGFGFGLSFGYPSSRYGYGGYGYGGYGYGGGYYDPWYGYGYGGYYPYYGGSYWSGYHRGYYDGSFGYGRPATYTYGRMDNRHYYGYSRTSDAKYGGSKGSTYVDPKYRDRNSSTNAATSVNRGTTSVRDPRSSTSSSGITRTNTGRNEQVRYQPGTDKTDRGNHYGNDRSDNNTRDRGDINRNQNPGNRTTAPGQVKRSNPGNVKTTRTRQPANVQQRTSTSNSRGTYTPSYSKPRTSSTPSYNRSTTPSRNYSQARSTQSRSSSYNRSSSSPSRSSSYNRSSSSPSRSSYSRPSSSGRSSSSYSRPSSPSRSSSSYSRSSSSPSRSSSSVSRSSSSSSRSSSSYSRSSGSSGRSSGSSGRSSGSSGRSSGSSSGRSSGSRR